MNTQIAETDSRQGNVVLGTFIDALNWNDVLNIILEWCKTRRPKVICLCNVHSSVTALSDKSLRNSLAASDMVLADGAPVAWVLRRKGFRKQKRIAGPDLMLKICAEIENTNISIFLFGSTQITLDKLTSNLIDKFPNLNISGALSPRYGTWSESDTTEYANKINESGAEIVFIGLGCPKQEIWMTDNRDKIKSVMLGVGAAFDFHAGIIKRAPLIFQHLGLEWLHRLLSEPKRLWKRYLLTNTKFIYLNLLDLFNIMRR